MKRRSTASPLIAHTQRLPLGRLILSRAGRKRLVERDRSFVPPLVARTQERRGTEPDAPDLASLRSSNVVAPGTSRREATYAIGSILPALAARRMESSPRDAGAGSPSNFALVSGMSVPGRPAVIGTSTQSGIDGARRRGAPRQRLISPERLGSPRVYPALTQLTTVYEGRGQSASQADPRTPPLPAYLRPSMAKGREPGGDVAAEPSRRSRVPGRAPGSRGREEGPSYEALGSIVGGGRRRPGSDAPTGDSGVKHGTIYLDGSALGQWMSDHLEQVMVRPSRGPSGVDPRTMPVWGPLSAGI